MQVSTPPTPLPPIDPQRSALFLDFDGTLAEIAPQPEAVHVPRELIELLKALSHRLDGALALISGRRLADLDAFLAPLQLPSAAEHGAERRLASGLRHSGPTPPLGAVTQVAQALAAQHAGLRVERKSAAVALHYRHAPELEDLCLAVMTEAVLRSPGLELLHGKYVLEAKPAGVNKGRAIAAFMAEPPFAGRQPWFAGDDLTDEAGFAWVQAVGGEGVKVGPGPSVARHRCPDPLALRDWLDASVVTLATAGQGASA
jgi:trehalose 6-phosphate phosphatase